MSKRCTNCGRFPFCKKEPKDDCEYWTEFIGDCIDCELKCGRLEDEKFIGTYRCIWKSRRRRMNRERLTQYLEKRQELQTDIKLIEKKLEDITNMTANYSNEKVSRGGKVINDPEAERLVAIIDQYNKKYAELRKMILQEEDEIERLINKIEKEVYRLILKKKYLLGNKFEDIANELHYTYKHICRLHGYALKEWDKI
jgi:uncharacterized protein YicC (UPF0701 family)